MGARSEKMSRDATQRKARPDWPGLHAKLRVVYSVGSLPRMVAALDNFRDRKESICRRLGVICEADVSRISAGIKKTKILTG